MAITSRESANEFERLLRKGTRAPVWKPISPARGRSRRRIPRDLVVVGGVVLLAIAGSVQEQRRRAAEPIQMFPYRNCSDAHAAGVRNIRSGDPRYTARQDRDGDGLACEPYP
ncbi:MAG TPA: excalibur calcium-binding domain-containing protein [Caulobacteraceae bacterium]|jgi:hypothetical protein